MRIVETIVGLAVEGFEPQHGMNTMHYKLRYSKTTLFLGGRGEGRYVVLGFHNKLSNDKMNLYENSNNNISKRVSDFYRLRRILTK